MIVKMRFLNISGPRDDIDRVCEKYLSKYEIGAETLALEVKKATPAGYVKEWKINGEAVTLGVEKQ